MENCKLTGTPPGMHRCNVDRSGASGTCRCTPQSLSCIACGLAVWFLVGICAVAAYASVFLFALLWSLPWHLRRKVMGGCCPERTDMDLVEKECILSMFAAGSQSEWIRLKPGAGRGQFSSTQWQAHRLFIPCQGAGLVAQPLIVIHGSNSAATILMSSCGARLSQTYELHCIDLPGYGRTPLPLGLSFADVERLSAEEFVDLQCEYIERYCVTCGIEHPLVVAHSAGAYWALMWAYFRRDASRLSGLILVSPAGAMPTFNNFGALAAIGMVLGLPHTFFRSLGTMRNYVLEPLVHNNAIRRYWLLIQSSPQCLCASKFARADNFSGDAIWCTRGEHLPCCEA